MKKTKAKVFYVCGVEWQHELGETHVRLYKSLKALKEDRVCWDSCGAVRIEMKPRWVMKQDLNKGIRRSRKKAAREGKDG